jgi:transcriptional regulator with GAF, ATPase, and Fis domain
MVLIDALAQRVLGHSLCTVMRLHSDTLELERVYSSRPDEYPVGGRKSKQGLPWAEHVLIARRVFVGTQSEDLREVFDDHLKLSRLGLGSVINTPIVLGGSCIGTLNLLHRPQWYENTDEPAARILAYLLAPGFFEA